MKLETGSLGEKTAEAFLKQKGYTLLKKNYRSALGEIDLIFLDKKTIAFIEVKTNTSDDYGLPQARVNAFKQKQIIKTALIFIKEFQMTNYDYRFDVIGVQMNDTQKPVIEHIQNAFDSDEYYY